MFTLNYQITDEFEDTELFDYLDSLDTEGKLPTGNTDPNLLCIYFINAYSTSGAVLDDKTITKCEGFNQLKDRLEILLNLKRKKPWFYGMLEYYAYHCK